MKQIFTIIDVSRCIDCNNCFVACKDEHVDNDWPGYTLSQPRHGHRWMNIHRHERGTYPLIDVAYRPTPCMHCAEPACAKAAPDCISIRPDGIVLINPDKAKGRKDIVSSCPYGAIYWNEELEQPQKCTMCAHLIDEGWAQPRCAQACFAEALVTVRLTKEEMERKAKAENLRQVHPEKGTKPRVYYKNLHMIDKAFIAGSLEVEVDGITDCAENIAIELFYDEKLIAKVVTDAFGDFKFDGLDCDNKAYTLYFNSASGQTQKHEVKLEKSMNLGNILLNSGSNAKVA